jgi:hypothetical protein
MAMADRDVAAELPLSYDDDVAADALGAAAEPRSAGLGRKRAEALLLVVGMDEKVIAAMSQRELEVHAQVAEIELAQLEHEVARMRRRFCLMAYQFGRTKPRGAERANMIRSPRNRASRRTRRNSASRARAPGSKHADDPDPEHVGASSSGGSR